MAVLDPKAFSRPLSSERKRVTESAGVDGGSGYASEAHVMCRGFVEGRMVSPGSADHPFLVTSKDTTQYLGNNQHKVRSYVNSRNRFGATIRTNYDCVIERSGEDWRLISLETR